MTKREAFLSVSMSRRKRNEHSLEVCVIHLWHGVKDSLEKGIRNQVTLRIDIYCLDAYEIKCLAVSVCLPLFPA